MAARKLGNTPFATFFASTQSHTAKLSTTAAADDDDDDNDPLLFQPLSLISCSLNTVELLSMPAFASRLGPPSGAARPKPREVEMSRSSVNSFPRQSSGASAKTFGAGSMSLLSSSPCSRLNSMSM